MKSRASVIVLIALVASFSTFSANADSSRIIDLRLSGANQIEIDATLYIPAKVPAPAILLAHGFGGDKSSVKPQAVELQKAGYVVLAWTARGFGKSSGEISMNSPTGEVADTRKLIDYLSTRAEVEQQKKGDPLIGITGDSYGGAISLLTAGYDPRIDAVAADITWNNLVRAFFPQNSDDQSQTGPYKRIWAGTFFAIATLQNALLGDCGTFTKQWCAAFKRAVATGTPTPSEIELMNLSSPSSVADKISAPTLLMQGEADSLFTLAESTATAQAIVRAHPQTPISLIWHGGGHDGGLDESQRLWAATRDWFDIYLKKENKVFPKFQITNTNGSISLTDSSVIPKFMVSDQLPFQSSSLSIPLTTPFIAVVAPIGGIPGAISSLPGLGSAISLAGGAAAFLPGQSGFLESGPLTKPISIVGGSRVRVKVTSNSSDATLFFSLVVRTASGQTKQPNGIVSPTHLTNLKSAGSEFTITLPSVVVDAQVGDKLAVAVSSTDQGFSMPQDGRMYTVSVISPLTVPVLKFKSQIKRSTFFVWPISAGIVLIFSILFAYIRRPRHSNAPRDQSDALVAVTNLSKVYKDGYQAVSDISFHVERGQVLGLLGPNGAGKTTILRMIMGLIFPTNGEISIDGKPIYPGSPTLANLGSFVEGAGFLPHLSGRENLHLYWKSIGRTDEPFFDEAVAITDLGTALDKKVRSYSQGMRQRLAIAQAMLGLPDLLVLDEPTNGLDPQQIKAMREVLKNYAKTGRTVIVSSHLLSEVEQTCTHVVLMHRGKLVAFGPMKQILAGKGKPAANLEEIFISLIGNDLTIGKEVG
ncbi:MAG: alpha/beta fold hydrolase [Actinobacteria bacterium]|nr:alpha/beta fold hydrolase [Actinomycetota bacterium]